MGFRADRDDRQEPTENQTDCNDSNSFEHFQYPFSRYYHSIIRLVFFAKPKQKGKAFATSPCYNY